MDKPIIETDFEKAKLWSNCLSLGDDILLADNLSQIPFPTDIRRLNFIFICLCTRGSVNFTLDMHPYMLSAGDLMIVSERHFLDDYYPATDFDGLCIIISIPFYQDFIQNISDLSALFLFAHRHPVLQLSECDQHKFSEYFRLIQSKMAETGHHHQRNLVRTLMQAFFYDLSDVVYHFQLSKDERVKRADTIFVKFIRLVEANCRRERRVGWYAQQMSITPKYLSETVKSVSRRTPNEWIDNYVMLELRVILKNTTKSIKTISEEMNFPNQSFFGKYFKSHVGKSPSEYRKS